MGDGRTLIISLRQKVMLFAGNEAQMVHIASDKRSVTYIYENKDSTPPLQDESASGQTSPDDIIGSWRVPYPNTLEDGINPDFDFSGDYGNPDNLDSFEWGDQ